MNKVSVVIPVYKAEQYLECCVESVLQQTHRNLEIILVDDGSPDGCGAMCDAYAHKDNRVRVIHQKNSGVAAARNAGIEIATGKWLAFVDADDYIDLDMYEVLLEAAEKSQTDVVECNYRRLGGTNPGTGKIHIHTGLDALEIMFTRDGYPDGFTVSPVNKLIRRDAANGIRFLEGCSMAEDMLYVVELLTKIQTIAKLERRLYTYRVNEDSATMCAYNVRKADEVDAIEQAMKIMDATEWESLVQIGRDRYISALQKHWRECSLLKEKRADDLRDHFKKNYSRLKVKLGIRQRVLFILFKFLPRLYLLIYARRTVRN